MGLFRYKFIYMAKRVALIMVIRSPPFRYKTTNGWPYNGMAIAL